MSESKDVLWSAPGHPPWLEQLNTEGSYLDLPVVVPLDEESLLAHACRSTGLDDFGDDRWREPFAVLCKSLEEEAQKESQEEKVQQNSMLQEAKSQKCLERTAPLTFRTDSGARGRGGCEDGRFDGEVAVAEHKAVGVGADPDHADQGAAALEYDAEDRAAEEHDEAVEADVGAPEDHEEHASEHEERR